MASDVFHFTFEPGSPCSVQTLTVLDSDDLPVSALELHEPLPVRRKARWEELLDEQPSYCCAT